MLLHGLVTLAAEAAGEEPDQTAYYVLGCALALWAVVVSFIGIRSHATFPGSAGGRAGVMAITTVLVAATMASAVITA